MSSTTEHKLRSKYDSSSKKIKELYQEFSVMKRNIHTPSKRANGQGSFFGSTNKRDRELFGKNIDVSIARALAGRQSDQEEGFMSLSFQTQNYMKSSCLKTLTCGFVEMSKKMDQRVNIMQDRLKNLKVLFEQVSIFMKIKQQKYNGKKINLCKCSQLEQIIKQIQHKYDDKISQLVSTYENKISLLMKESHGQDTSDSSNAKKLEKELQDQLHQFEDKLVVKEQEITNLKITNSRLRRALDQHKVLVVEKQALVEELSKEIEDKDIKLGQMAKLKIEKIAFQQKQCQCDGLKLSIVQLKKDMEKLTLEKQQIEKQFKDLQENENKKSRYFLPSENEQKNDWNEPDIQEQCVLVHSQDEDDNEYQLGEHLKVQKQDNFEPLRHTQYFHPMKYKQNRYEQKIKQLQAQIQLLSQQNNLLKTKKDKFEEQCKQNESDQQKFQMQCQILRDELKNVNANLKILDQCAVSYLKEKKANQESVEKLIDSIKFKQEYFKKFPRKKLKSLTKI